METLNPPRRVGGWRRRLKGDGASRSADEKSDDDSNSNSNEAPQKAVFRRGVTDDVIVRRSDRPQNRSAFRRPTNFISKDDSDPSLMTKETFGRHRGTTADDILLDNKNTRNRLKQFTMKFNPLTALRTNKNSPRSSAGQVENRRVSRSVSFDSDNADMQHASHSERPRGFSNDSSVGPTFTPPRNINFSLDMISSAGTNTMTSSFGDEGARGSLDSSSYHSPGERARYSVHHGSRGGKKKFRVRPYRCFPDAVYMTEEEIYADSLKPSEEFEFVKSYLAPSFRLPENKRLPAAMNHMWGSPEEDGRIGSLRMEVLGCISLARQKPDVAVYLVCGDAAFCTDVLTGYRSPMWPASSKRAVVFPIHHAYAKIFIGVFDVKVRKNKDNDVFCGRVAVDVASIRPDTEYDVTFPLRASTFVYDRKARGVLRVRFSLHWFNERAAAFSYFSAPKSVAASGPLVGGFPTIPCADPKTFRNVAVTVYGQDLPGKYTKTSFRATMREFNLYQQNLRQMVKIMLVDAIMYERPLVSLYLFIAGMHCVITSSIRLVPPYCVGYLLILFLENHQHYVSDTSYNLGYKPLTLWEIAMGVIFHFEPDETSFGAIMLQKRTKQRRTKNLAAQRLRKLNSLESTWSDIDPEKEVEIQPLDHREFPFAEREAYPKFVVEDALAASGKSGRRASTSRLHGRLSVYYTSAQPTEMEAAQNNDDDDDSDEDSDRDDETVMSESNMGDMIFGMDLDDDDEFDMEIAASQDSATARGSLFQSGTASTKQRLRVGPPQNSDTKALQRIPPQVHLLRIERMLHKISGCMALEQVHPPPGYGEPETAAESAGSGSKNDAVENMKKKRPQLDEFDKKLGLQSRSANPVTRIASTFLGPLMRIIRILIFLVRISFNVSTWRDPYLSFWTFIALSLLCVFLIWFPWRAFFLVAIFASVGPQNLFLRWYLEKKEERKRKQREEEEADRVIARKDAYGYETAEPSLAQAANASVTSTPERKADSPPTRRVESSGVFGISFYGSSKFAGASGNLAEEKVERPPFRSDGSTKKTQPKAVIIPYSRLKRDRFYDWPPDPTVSRATPLPTFADFVAQEIQVDNERLPDEFVSFVESGGIRQRKSAVYMD